MTRPAIRRPVIGITLGSTAGIGSEVIQRALRDPKLPRGFDFETIGRVGGIKPGRSTRASARVAYGALEEAFKGWKEGRLQAIVTGPIQKETMAEVGFPFPGQTEFFARRCGLKADDAVMVLTDRKLTVALVSTHLSLRDALRAYTAKKLIHVAGETVEFFRRLGRPYARIAVAGINPHAGENGLFGREERTIIVPAVRELQRNGLAVSGPYSPDTVFHRTARGEFDAVVCAYHDQGLIPFKLLAFTTGVNVTLGLPLVRTSPDHGTALDLAGKDRADASSMLAAIQMACRLVKSNGTLSLSR